MIRLSSRHGWISTGQCTHLNAEEPAISDSQVFSCPGPLHYHWRRPGQAAGRGLCSRVNVNIMS
jgi:hypothetical protein